jgi:hypothetical protein
VAEQRAGRCWLFVPLLIARGSRPSNHRNQ